MLRIYKVLSVVRVGVCLKCLAETVSVPCRQSGLANMRGLSHKGKGLPQAALRGETVKKLPSAMTASTKPLVLSCWSWSITSR